VVSFSNFGIFVFRFGIELLYIVDCVCLSQMSRSPSPPVLERQRSPSSRVLPRQLPLRLFASGQLVEGSFGDRSKENVRPLAHQVKPKDASLLENVRPSAHLVTPNDASPLEDRGPDKKKTRTLEEGAIGRTPTSGAEGGEGRSDETPTRMLWMGVVFWSRSRTRRPTTLAPRRWSVVSRRRRLRNASCSLDADRNARSRM